MTDISKLCMNCLGQINENGVCPDCRKETDFVQVSPLLQIKTMLTKRYVIAKARKKNSEGITYSAYDLTLEKPVSIREFFPEQIASRDADELTVIPVNGKDALYSQYLDSFISLWTKIMRLKGLTALVSVSDVFQANGTAYAVYDESERITLRDYLLDTKEGYIPWEKARIMFMPVLSTLGTLHTSGVFHRGINPASFIFSKDGKLKLTDFCIEPARTAKGAIEPEIFDGFAPLEQYSSTERTGAWSDIYSFCSVLYRALIGTNPIDAKTRALNDQMMIPAKFAEQLPPYVINAIINGMTISHKDRTDNIEQLRSELSASPRAIGASATIYPPKVDAPPTAPPTPPAEKPAKKPVPVNPTTPEKTAAQKYLEAEEAKKKNKKKNALIAILCILLVALIGGIGFLLSIIFGSPSSSQQETTTSSASSIVSVPNFVGGYISDIITNEQYTTYFRFQTQEEFSSTVMAGVVIEQNIPQYAQATVGDTIILTVSKGPKSLALPDVTGKTFEQAEQEFLSLGLVPVKSAMHNDGTHTGGTIAETIPAANQVVKEGDRITILVYTYLDEETSAPENSTPENSGNGNSVEEFLESLNTTVPDLSNTPIQ